MAHAPLTEQLHFLQELLQVIRGSDYTTKSTMLGNNSIGEHMRHVIEMIQCLLSGYERGTVDYDERKRDTRIETDTSFTSMIIQELLLTIQKPDKTLVLKQHGSDEAVASTYKRELLYNTEHAIHHMALIRVALREIGIDITSENFGIAPATIRYKESAACAR